MVTVLVMVAITPLVGVYIFSVEFINRGIDNWFSIDVEQGLANALELGQTALDIQTRGKLDEVRAARATSSPTSSSAELVPMLSTLRTSSDALELTLYGRTTRSSASTSVDPERSRAALSERRSAVPAAPVAALRQHRAASRTASTRSSRRRRCRRRATRGETRASCRRCFRSSSGLSTLANAVQAQLQPVRRAHVLAHGAQVRLHAHAEPRAVDLAARVRLRRVLLLASPRRADSAADARHARGRARRLRDARADARRATRSAFSCTRSTT